MSDDRWGAVEEYLVKALAISDPILDAALADNTAAGLPAIDVAPNAGKLLQLFARLTGSRKILEIGTLGGYSTIWLGRALPVGGLLVTLEADPRHAAVAQSNIARALLSEVVEVRVGLALDTLPQLERDGIGPFDFIFIDADKANNPEYFQWALRLSRPGTVIVVDNVVRKGAVLDKDTQDRDLQGIRRLFQVAASEPRVTVTALQTVGSKGWDGFLVALVTAE
ncbi:MAG TPA: O-methyltransferase [Bryobacteraceae bacterium]|jgi:predicted O-methyltransferase YrrM|nr:O-methyltransferase [Bryobacteraceae bacterium]